MKLPKPLFNFIIKTFLALICFLLVCICFKKDIFADKLYNILFRTDIDFAYIKSKTKKIVGNITKKDNTSYVTSTKFNYKDIIKEENGYKLITDYNYVVNNLCGGVVIFIGDKDGKKNSIIIAGDDGVNYWYANIENISVNLYDYVDESKILGNTIDNYLYLTFIKDNEYLSYEDFI